jgi:Fe(3+) dicitrate transport protein
VLAQDDGEGRIEGQVVAAADGRPLASATVSLEEADGRRGTATDDAGRFVLRRVPAGSATLQIRHVGYVSETRTVRVQADEATSVTVRLRSATVALAGVEIISSSEEARAVVPGAMTKVDAAALQALDPIGMQEALAYVPGVYGLADDGMGQTRMSVGIRGLQPRRTQRVLVMEDGVPIQPAPYVFSPLYYNPPIERIREVEVIKGSAAIRHGPQTMGGVINYVTSRPRRRTPGGTLQLTGGTNRYVSAFSEIGGFGTDTVRPQVQLLAKRGDGFRENNDFVQLNGTAKLQAQIGANRSLYLKTNVDYERMNATYTGLTPYTFRNDPSFNPKDDDFYRIFRASVDAIYERRFSDRVEGTTTLYANVFDRPWWREKDVFVRASDFENPEADIEPVSPSTPGPLVRVGISDAVDDDLNDPYFGNERTFYVGGVEQSLDIRHGLFGQAASLEVGGRLHWERFRDDRKISDEVGVREGVFFRGDPSDPESLEIVGGSSTYETTALALYALEEITWGRLRLSPGVRLEVFEQSRIDRLAGSTYRDKTSVVPLPGFGFNLDLGRYAAGPALGESQFWLFGGIHRGYTPPSSATFQIVGFDPPTAADEADDGFDLRAEKSWNTELGLRGRTGIGRFEATGFYLYVEDLVGGRTSFQQNLGVVQSYGVEAQGTLDGSTLLGPLPTVNVSYTYLQSEVVRGIVPGAIDGVPADISGNALPAAPNHVTSVRLSKEIPALNLSLYTDMRYNGRFYTDLENFEDTTNRGERGPVPDYTLFNAGATYDVSEALRLKLTAKNLTDNVYIGSRVHSNPRQRSANLSTGIIPGARRQINLAVTYDF